jgi:hypothetical protein
MAVHVAMDPNVAGLELLHTILGNRDAPPPACNFGGNARAPADAQKVPRAVVIGAWVRSGQAEGIRGTVRNLGRGIVVLGSIPRLFRGLLTRRILQASTTRNRTGFFGTGRLQRSKRVYISARSRPSEY